MFPSSKGSYQFNGANQKEWQISHGTDVTFVVYGTLWIFPLLSSCLIPYPLDILGKNLDGAVLSFTSHPDTCKLERRDHLYTLTVTDVDSQKGMSEHALVTINLPYYDTTLYVCLQPPNATDSFHQGDQ